MAQNMSKKVIVGMSGGVDSSVSALLLKQQGYTVIGVFMKNWEEDDTEEFCSAAQDIADAKQVCEKLQIPFYTTNFAAEYWDSVFEYFLTEYNKGRTPNPDILCNKEIKFKVFLEYAKELKADYIATGHYVRKITDENNNHKLAKGLDANKDQSYFLYTLKPEQLTYTLFPVGELAKSEVRAIAKAHNLINHNKKDSTGICFIGERRFKEFLQKYLPAQPGEICTPEGRILGAHDGLMYYTIGQRQGLRIGGVKGASEEPWYVIDKDLTRNILLVAQGDNPLLYSTMLSADTLEWINPPTKTEFNCTAKIRYRQLDVPCKVTLMQENNECIANVQFEQAQKAVTPGQSVVFYQDNICLGGGIIR